MEGLKRIQEQIIEPLDKSLNKLIEVSKHEKSLRSQIARFIKTLFSSGSTIWASDAAYRTKKLEKYITNLETGLSVERAVLKQDGTKDALQARYNIEETVSDKLDEVLAALFELKAKASKKEKDKITNFEEDVKILRESCQSELEAVKNEAIKRGEPIPTPQPPRRKRASQLKEAQVIKSSPQSAPKKTVRSQVTKTPEHQQKEADVKNLKEKLQTIQSKLGSIANKVPSNKKNDWNNLKAQLNSLIAQLSSSSNIESVRAKGEEFVTQLYVLAKTEMPTDLF